MTEEEAATAKLPTSAVSDMLGISQATVARIPRDKLDYWTTPGGHRRYREADVRRYAREVLGRTSE